MFAAARVVQKPKKHLSVKLRCPAPPVPKLPSSLPQPPAKTEQQCLRLLGRRDAPEWNGADDVLVLTSASPRSPGGVGDDSGTDSAICDSAPAEGDSSFLHEAFLGILDEAQRTLAKDHARAAGQVTACYEALLAENRELRGMASSLAAFVRPDDVMAGTSETALTPEKVLGLSVSGTLSISHAPVRPETPSAWLPTTLEVASLDALPGQTGSDAVVEFTAVSVASDAGGAATGRPQMQRIGTRKWAGVPIVNHCDSLQSDVIEKPLSMDSYKSNAPSTRQSDVSLARSSSVHSFELLPMWKRTTRKDRVAMVTIAKDVGSQEFDEGLHMEMEEQAASAHKEYDCSVVHPNSAARSSWDFVSLFLVVYDMVVIPLLLIDIPTSGFLEAMAWITRIFWTLDMPATVGTGYITRDGSVELRHKEIWRHYFKTWFGLDLFVVAIDWIELAFRDVFLRFAGAGRLSRIIRVVRLARLLRLARMREVVSVIAERISSEKLLVILDIVKITVVVISLAHFIGCIWYCLSDLVDEEETWIVHYGFSEKTLSARYMMSLHWSLSQFAGGMDEITPKNVPERIFAVIVFMMAFLVASAFVSNLTSSMTQLYIIGSKSAQELSTLRRYLNQNKISKRLAMRVNRNAQHALQEIRNTCTEEGVELLSVISEPLRVELHFELYREMISVHPFFAKYVQECPQVMRRVCHLAMEFCFISVGDVIFSIGENPAQPKMYFVISGTLQYVSHSGRVTEVQQGQWVSEATLWIPWIHLGVLTATSDCRLCKLDAHEFQEIVGQFEHTGLSPAEYAAEFLSRLNFDEEDISDMTPSDPFNSEPDAEERSRASTVSHFAKFLG